MQTQKVLGDVINMIKRYGISTLLIVTLVSCGKASSTGVPSNPPTSTIPPKTVLIETSTPTKTHISTVSPNMMHYQCLKIAVSLPSDRVSKGVIVYNDDANLHATLWNNETMSSYSFPREDGDRLFHFEVSPDGKYIIYIHSSIKTNEDRLILATSEGKVIWSKVISSIAWDWFDNERLLHLEFSQDGTHMLQLLNPFNSEQQELRADFPDSEMFSVDWYGGWYYMRRGSPVYDPTLSEWCIQRPPKSRRMNGLLLFGIPKQIKW